MAENPAGHRAPENWRWREVPVDAGPAVVFRTKVMAAPIGEPSPTAGVSATTVTAGRWSNSPSRVVALAPCPARTYPARSRTRSAFSAPPRTSHSRRRPAWCWKTLRWECWLPAARGCRWWRSRTGSPERGISRALCWFCPRWRRWIQRCSADLGLLPPPARRVERVRDTARGVPARFRGIEVRHRWVSGLASSRAKMDCSGVNDSSLSRGRSDGLLEGPDAQAARTGVDLRG